MSSAHDTYLPVVREIAEEVRAAQSNAAALLVMRAYLAASEIHDGEWRKDGSPYVSHCVAVARIACSVEPDAVLVSAALLHDALDSGHGPRLRREFDPAIVLLVEAGEAANREPERFVGAVVDRSLLTLKLADRLHNLRTIGALERGIQLRKAEQTLRVLVPLAEAAGSPLREDLQDAARLVSDQGVGHSVGGEARGAGSGLLEMAAVGLPSAVRERWLTEWKGELATLGTRRARWRFACEVLWAMPALAIVTRRRGEPS